MIWAGITSALVMFGLLMCANEYTGFMATEPLPRIAPYLLWGGLATLLLPLVYLPRYRRDLQAFRQMWREQAVAETADQALLAQQQGRAVIGYALCDLPAMAGIVYYVLSSDLAGGLLLVIASIIILLQYKPA